MIRNDDLRRRHGSSTYKSTSDQSKKSARYFRNGGNSKSKSKTDSQLKNDDCELDEFSEQPQEAARTVAFVTTEGGGGKKHDWDAESQSSRAKIITQTTTWGVSSSAGQQLE